MNLLTRRICDVLIIANPYDAFMLEDDVRIEEKPKGKAVDSCGRLALRVITVEVLYP